MNGIDTCKLVVRHQFPLRSKTLPLSLLGMVLLLASVGCGQPAATENKAKSKAITTASSTASQIVPDQDGRYHVYEGSPIQPVLDAAARDTSNKTVIIHQGTYRPAYPSQAMIRFHRQHDGLNVEAEGEVILTAQNTAISVPGTPGHPAVVNHVVYFGDGISPRTQFTGFRITGASGFVTDSESDGPIEPSSNQPALQKRLFFYMDGGAIKIFGRSYPVLNQLRIVNNETRLCGGGISVEHRGFRDESVVIRNCVFQGNRSPGTGAAIDLLEGSQAMIENCLFVGNISNYGMEAVAAQFGLRYKETHGCGALTVFPESRATVMKSTFTANWNGADDKGDCLYQDCIFWQNSAVEGGLPGGAYELDAAESSVVQNCWIHGNIDDLQGTVDATTNTLRAPDPLFNDRFEPTHPKYDGVGYRATYATTTQTETGEPSDAPRQDEQTLQ